MLPPAHCLVFTPGSEPQIRQYWSLSFSEHPEIEDWSEQETVDRLLELLQRRVERRLISDVPFSTRRGGAVRSVSSIHRPTTAHPYELSTGNDRCPQGCRFCRT